jgi:hypothetical protein
MTPCIIDALINILQHAENPRQNDNMPLCVSSAKNDFR